MSPSDLQAFEEEVALAWEAGRIRGPVHLGGDESGHYYQELIKIFQAVEKDDWVFCSYRSHCHALLKGIPRDEVMGKILGGHSMTLQWSAHRFLSSAIVAGQLPIAVGVALALKRQKSKAKVWCFCGDMAASTGGFNDTTQYAVNQHLNMRFVIEDNGLSCDSPTDATWGNEARPIDRIQRFRYVRRWPHVGTGKFVDFPAL